MSLYAISDLHIYGADDPLYASLLRLIARTQSGDTLVLAGDIFDFLLGDKPIFMERYSAFFDALKAAAARGASLHYIEGNHDFTLKPAFVGISGIKVHDTEVAIEVGGRRFYFAHGDLADSKDYGYRALRLVFRSPFTYGLSKILPGEWVDRIGTSSSKYSRGAKPLLPEGRIEALRKIYRSFAAERVAEGYDFVVMGHCHDLDEMEFSVGGHRGQYINIGYPRAHGSFVSWAAGDEKIKREALV